MNVDVVVVTYNSAAHVPALLDALGAEQAPTVVDNASSDGSAEVAERFGATVIRSEVNAGFAVACNRGARRGSSPVVVFVNPDAALTAASLKALVAAFDDPRVGVASPTLRDHGGGEQRVRWPYPTASGAWAEALGLRRVRRQSPHPDRGFVVGACFAVRRSAFEAVGGFDERFWLYGEEADLCWRLERRGWAIEVLDGVVAEHVGGASGAGTPDGARSTQVAEHFARGGEHFVAKHSGPAALVSYRMATLAGSGLRAGLRVGGRVAEHRWRVSRTLARLHRQPASVPLDSPATRAVGRGLVVCSLEAWDEVWRRNQFLVRELLAADPDLRVLFVEPAYDVLHERRRRSQRPRRRGLRPVEGHGRVVCFEPVKWLPRRLGPWADRWRDHQVRRAVAELGFVDPALWVNDLSYAAFAEGVAWPAVLDLTDDWSQVKDSRVARAAKRDEQALLRRCEHVVACSEALAEARRSIRPDLVVIPNAVDADHFQAPQPRPGDLAPAPVAVYVGTLHTDRVDVELLCELAAAVPAAHITLVGPNALDSASTARLEALPNVVLLGPRPYNDVPAYLQHAGVVIVPHVVSPFTESLDPIKLYECLAVGRPTVATPVAGFRGAGAPVRVVPRERFVEAARQALAEGSASVPQPVPSWAERAEAFVGVLRSARAARGPSRLRVAYIDHCAQLSGGELALARLLPALDAVDPVVLLGEDGPLVEMLRRDGIQVEVLPLGASVVNTRKDAVRLSGPTFARAVASLRDVAVLARRLRQLDVDLVHTNSLKADLLGGLAARLIGVPLVWHLRDRLAVDYLPPTAVRLMRFGARVLPQAVIANSRATAMTLPRSVHATVIGSPLPAPPRVSLDRAPRGEADLRVTMVGRLAPWKGQDVFLRAFAEAFPRGGARAVIAGTAMFGEDDFAASLCRLAAELGIAEQVDFAGFVHDIPELLVNSDVLVHASVIPEPFGQVIIEAMAAGCAVIASDAGGPSEIVTNETNGLLVRPGDFEALGAALRRLLAEPELRQRLAKAGLERAEDFLPGKVARQVAEFQSRIVSAAG